MLILGVLETCFFAEKSCRLSFALSILITTTNAPWQPRSLCDILCDSSEAVYYFFFFFLLDGRKPIKTGQRSDLRKILFKLFLHVLFLLLKPVYSFFPHILNSYSSLKKCSQRFWFWKEDIVVFKM